MQWGNIFNGREATKQNNKIIKFLEKKLFKVFVEVIKNLRKPEKCVAISFEILKLKLLNVLLRPML
jgi:hypothetical protein